MRTSTLAGAFTVAALAAAPAVAGAATTTTYLDSHAPAPTASKFVGPTADTQVAAAGKNYQVSIAGIVSVYSKANWTNPRFVVSGKPGVPPSFKSPGIDNSGPTGSDIATRFAAVGKGPVPLGPTTNVEFSLDGGVTFFHPTTYTHSAGNSIYNYKVVGEGHRIEVRYFDPAPQDNYGRFRIKVTPTK
jgi:hypothetical protein